MAEPGRLPSMGSHRVGHDSSNLAAGDLGSIPGLIPWRREMLPTPILWPGEFHDYSPWGRKESDTTESLSLSLFSHN